MPVFISYCHEDKDFVDRLAAHLVQEKTHVWVDTWELHVGDSIVSKIQEAIQEASALIVVLSKASVESEWCKKELNAGLIRELEEKRVVVLPVLLNNCNIPLFLRDKMYADFRHNYDKGLRHVLEAIAKVTSDTLGRVEEPEWHIDWAIDWSDADGRFWLRLTLVEQAEGQPYSVLTEVVMLCNDEATSRYQQYAKAGIEPFGRQVLLETLRGTKEFCDLDVLITDSLTFIREIGVYDSKTNVGFEVKITCRRLGEDTGKDILLHVGRQVCDITQQLQRSRRRLTPEELRKVEEIRSQTNKSGTLPGFSQASKLGSAEARKSASEEVKNQSNTFSKSFTGNVKTFFPTG